MSNGSAIQLGGQSIQAYDADELIWRFMFDGPLKTLKHLVQSHCSKNSCQYRYIPPKKIDRILQEVIKLEQAYTCQLKD